MKVFIINSFRSMVYIAFLAIIAYGGVTGWINRDLISEEFGVTMEAAAAIGIVGGLIAGWIGASLVCGLIVTLLDIRDDLNDRLPDARED